MHPSVEANGGESVDA